MSKNPEITRQSMEPVVLREIDSGWDTTSAIRKAAAAYIPGLLNPHGHEARCLDKALKSMSTKERGLIERVNPPEEYRNVWAMTDRGRLSLAYPPAPPAVEAPASVGVADSYADLQARAIAAEERAQGLAEQLAEERKRRERARNAHLEAVERRASTFMGERDALFLALRHARRALRFGLEAGDADVLVVAATSARKGIKRTLARFATDAK